MDQEDEVQTKELQRGSAKEFAQVKKRFQPETGTNQSDCKELHGFMRPYSKTTDIS